MSPALKACVVGAACISRMNHPHSSSKVSVLEVPSAAVPLEDGPDTEAAGSSEAPHTPPRRECKRSFASDSSTNPAMAFY